jgi:hypothetical protein
MLPLSTHLFSHWSIPLNRPERSEGVIFFQKSPIMCFASTQKITSQTIRISGALESLFTGATTNPKFYHFIVDYRFWLVLHCLE